MTVTSNPDLQDSVACIPDNHISEEHRAYLETRAVDPDLAILAGARSVSPESGGLLLGRDRPLPCGGIAIPHGPPGSPTWHVRLDTPHAGARYLIGAGVDPRPFVPSTTVLEYCGLEPRELRDTEHPLVIVESALGALALLRVGLVAVGMCGVSRGHDPQTWRQEERHYPHPDLVALELRDRSVVMLFDAGVGISPAVAGAEAQLAAALGRAGATVRSASLPLYDGAHDLGPDEFLCDAGLDSLMEVIEASRLADPLEVVRQIVEHETQEADARVMARDLRARIHCRLAPLFEELRYQAALQVASSATIDRLREEVREAARISAATITDAIKSFERACARELHEREDPATSGKGVDKRRTIIVDLNEHRVVGELISALAERGEVFKRGPELVEVLRRSEPALGNPQARRLMIKTIGPYRCAAADDHLISCGVDGAK